MGNREMMMEMNEGTLSKIDERIKELEEWIEWNKSDKVANAINEYKRKKQMGYIYVLESDDESVFVKDFKISNELFNNLVVIK